MPATGALDKPLDVTNPTDALAAIVGAAESALGVMYEWGGNSLAEGVDCSGLVQQAYAAAGISLPRVSNQQANVGQRVGSLDEARAGDLLSWDNSSRNNGADHIAIYIGNGLMIEAPRRGEPVRVTQVRDGARINRVLGVLPATNPGNVRLGPNQDRKFTAAAVGLAPSVEDAQGQPEVVDSSGEKDFDGGLGDGLPENASEEETLNYIRENLPQYAGWLGNDEIRYVLTWAVREDKGAAEIQGALMDTNYFQTHSATSRSVDTFLGTAGQAEITRVTDLAKNHVSDLFARNGIQLDDPTLSRLAMQALRAGDITLQGQVMNPQGLNALLAFGLGQGVNAGENLPAGEASFNADRVRQIATGEFMLPLTQREANEWSVRLLNGQATEESFRGEMTQRARERYPWLTQHLDAGGSVASATDRLRAVIADTLELDADQVNLMEPKYKGVFEFYDGKAQAYRSMTLGEAAQWARDQPEWQRTQQGRAVGAGVTRGLVDFIEGRTG